MLFGYQVAALGQQRQLADTLADHGLVVAAGAVLREHQAIPYRLVDIL